MICPNCSLIDATTSYLNATQEQEAAFSGRPEYAVIVPIVWIILIIIGAVGNGLVIYTLSKNGEITATNCYIVNLAIADMTFLLVVVPLTAASYAMPDWIFGDFMCRTASYMIYVSMYVVTFVVVKIVEKLRFEANYFNIIIYWTRKTISRTIVSLFNLFSEKPFEINKGLSSELFINKN